jgi:hypothetical protein
MDTGQLALNILSGLFGLAAILGIFFLYLVITRELIGWYFKTNEIIKLLKQIEENTQETE